MLLHAAAGVVLLDLRNAETQQVLPFIGGQAVERFAGCGEVGRQRYAERAQQLSSVEPDRDHALLDRGRHRLAIHGRREG